MPWRVATEEEDGPEAALMGCHIWTGWTTPKGIPVVRTATSSTTAAKLLWERENGPVPKGRLVGSLCSNRLCVRPRHHEPMTPRQIAYRSGQTRLTPTQQTAIQLQYIQGVGITEIARRYETTRTAIYRVLKGSYYRPREHNNKEKANG